MKINEKNYANIGAFVVAILSVFTSQLLWHGLMKHSYRENIWIYLGIVTFAIFITAKILLIKQDRSATSLIKLFLVTYLTSSACYIAFECVRSRHNLSVLLNIQIIIGAFIFPHHLTYALLSILFYLAAFKIFSRLKISTSIK
jgi:hypothetical protein